MISLIEEISALKTQEQSLHTSLDNLRGQRSKVREHRQLDKELAGIIRKRQNYESLARFEVGMPVNRADSKLLGHICDLKITPGGLAEVWVSWDSEVEIPESPNLLQPDEWAIAQIISVGDRITVSDGHELSGKTFVVAQLMARGAVETKDEHIFEREDWVLFESPVGLGGKENEELTSNDDAKSVTTPEIQMVEESSPKLEVLSEVIVTVEAVVTTTQEIGELTEDEEQERHQLELKVERAYYEAGSALRELRDKRLYRSTHRTFEEYCQDRFGFQRRHCYRLIEAANVVDNLQEFCVQFGHILPATESVCRSLTIFQPPQQIKAWQQILQETGGKHPTGKEVKGIVERLKEKPLFKASDFCCVGDVFTLTRLEGAERKYNGCWAISFELRDFTIAVDVYDTTLAVKPDNLNPIDLPDVRRQLPETLKRIRRLRECDLLDRCVYTVLESLGRQMYLTDFENKLLTFMEQEHGIEK